ncbi:Mut7-C RNAse domain-containing protein [Hydrogenimonas sp.]
MKRFCIRWDKRPRFVCDVHLARVAKYLRLLGFDTVYRNDISDDELIGRCRFGRIGLTCDRRLQKRAPESIIVLRCEDAQKQVRRLDAVFDLKRYALPFRRSLCCNRLLVPAEKNLDIPKETYRWLTGFWRCPRCGKLYWKGTHTERMRQKVYSLLDYQKKC